MIEFMKCVVEGIAANGVKGLLELAPGGKYVYDVGAYAIKRHREKKAQKKLEDEVKELIGARADAAFAQAKRAVEEAAPDLSPREKELVTQYVAAIPEAARQSLKRKEDPTGSSLPFGYTIHETDDVVKLLPQHAPRFVPGEFLPGREDNWRLERRLGGGGFGEVWLVRHCFKRNERPRAVKFCTDASARQKLVTHEKQLIVRVMEHAGDHPNIVPLLECHLSGDTPWLMYEYVDGGTLTDAILEWQKFAPAERVKRAISALHTIAGAIGHCHAIEPAIIHRDLKPANVLRDAAGALRVTDFGIGGNAVDFLVAEETRGVRSVVGRLPTMLSGSYSLLYASPEQRKGERPDPRDDVHALGVIAYQMLTGDLSAAPGRDMDDDLRDAGVADELISLIGKSVSQKAERRPKDAREWETALAALRPKAPTAPVASPPAPPPPVNATQPAPAPRSDHVSNLVPASPVDAKPPEPAREQKWNVTVAGTWYSRPAGDAHAEWLKVAETPAEITTRAGEVYRFSVSGSGDDAALAGLADLKGLSALQSLGFWFCGQVADAGLAHLKGLSALESLDLRYCKRITDVGLAHLKGLSALRTLDLRGCERLTDAGLAHLRELPVLQSLNLAGCLQLTDAVSKYLKKLPALRFLDLQDCERLTDAGLAALERSLPKCRIER